MLGEADRLGRLHVGASWQNGINMGFCLFYKDAGKLAGQTLPFAKSVRDEQTKVQSDLIVAAASRVELLPHISHQFGEAALNIHMNIFQFLLPLE